MPVCTSSKISSMPLSSHNWRNALKNELGADRTPPSPCTGSIRMAAVSGPIAFLTASRSPCGTWSNPSSGGPKPSRYFAEPVGGQRAQRAAVEGAFEGDEAIALGMALGSVIAARDLDRAFHGLGAGITEEHEIGKTLLAQPRRELVAVRAPEQVRHVPELCRLLLQRLDQMRVRVAERIHRNTGSEVEIAIAVGGDEEGALAAFEAEIDPGEDGKQMRWGAVGHGCH